jgi:uncharacterized protein YbcI
MVKRFLDVGGDRENGLSAPRRGGVLVKTKGELEAELSQAVIRFEKEFLGRGPIETKAYLLEDMAIIRLKNVLTQAEIKLVQAKEPSFGRDLIKTYRQQLFEQGRSHLEPVIQEILGVNIRSMHTDVSTVTGERVIIFTLDAVPSFR